MTEQTNGAGGSSGTLADQYQSWRAFYGERVKAWLSTEELRDACGGLKDASSAPNTELLLVHAMRELERLSTELQQARQEVQQQAHQLAQQEAATRAQERERWVELLTEKWHAGEGKGQTLAEYLGMTDAEYAEYVFR